MSKCKEVSFPVCYSEFVDNIDGFYINRYGLTDTYNVIIFKHWGGVRNLKTLVSGVDFWKSHLKIQYNPFDMKYNLIDHNKFK